MHKKQAGKALLRLMYPNGQMAEYGLITSNATKARITGRSDQVRHSKADGYFFMHKVEKEH
jgi:hypothetical protein